MNLEIGKTYTFATTAPGILGTEIKNALLESILSFNVATKYDNIVLKYRQIYPQLPQGTPNTPESCIYFLFKTESGEEVVFADQWINESTIEVIEHINFQVLFTSAAIQDMTRVRDAMNALGYTNFQIKQL